MEKLLTALSILLQSQNLLQKVQVHYKVFCWTKSQALRETTTLIFQDHQTHSSSSGALAKAPKYSISIKKKKSQKKNFLSKYLKIIVIISIGNISLPLTDESAASKV